MNSHSDGHALSPVHYQDLKNVRIEGGIIQVREGADPMSVTGLLDGVCVGLFQSNFLKSDGSTVFRTYIAVDEDLAAATKVFVAEGDLDGASFSEVTGTSSGQARFPDGTTHITFAVFKDQHTSPFSSEPFFRNEQYDRCLYSDGITCQVDGWVVPTRMFVPDPGSVTQWASFPDYIDQAPATTTTGSSANVTVTDNTAHSVTGGACWRAVYSTSAVSTNYGEWTQSSGSMDLGSSNELVLFYTCNDADVWDKMSIQVYDATDTAWRTVWAASGDFPPDIYDADTDKSIKMAVFKLTEDGTLNKDNGHTGLRVTYTYGSSPGTAITLEIVAVHAGGWVTGGASFAVASFDPKTRAEGPSIICLDKGGKRCEAHDDINRVPIPVFNTVKYEYRINYQEPTADWITNECPGRTNTGTNIYMNEFPSTQPGDFIYGYHFTGGCQEASASVAGDVVECGGTWSPDTLNNDDGSSPLTTAMHRPDSNCVPFPPASAYFTYSGRLYVGGAKLSNTNINSDLLISEDDAPMRFRNYARKFMDGVYDPASAQMITIGGENIKWFDSISGQVSTKDPIFVGTDSGVWVLGGQDVETFGRPVRVSPHGSLSPEGHTVHNNTLYYADTNGQIRTLGFSNWPISRNVVESRLAAIPDARKDDISMTTYKDRIYIAYTPSGGTKNEEILIYDTEVGEFKDGWTYDDLSDASLDAEFMFIDQYSGKLHFVTQGSTASTPAIFEHEQSGKANDNGTAINVLLRTAKFHNHFWTNIFAGEAGIVCEQDTGKTLTVTREFYPSGDAVAGTVDIADGSDSYVWRVDEVAADSVRTGGEGVSFDVKWQGDMTGGKKIFALGIDSDSWSGRAEPE